MAATADFDCMPTICSLCARASHWLLSVFLCIVLGSATSAMAQTAPTIERWGLFSPAFATAPLDTDELERVREAAYERVRAAWPELALISLEETRALERSLARVVGSHETIGELLRKVGSSVRPLRFEVECWEYSKDVKAFHQTLQGRVVLQRGCAVVVRDGPSALGANVGDPLVLESWLVAARQLRVAAAGEPQYLVLAGAEHPERVRVPLHVTITARVGQWKPIQQKSQAAALEKVLAPVSAECDEEGPFVLWIDEQGVVTKARTQSSSSAPIGCLVSALRSLRFDAGRPRALIGRVQQFEVRSVAPPPGQRVSMLLPTASDYVIDDEAALAAGSLDYLFRTGRAAIAGCFETPVQVKLQFVVTASGALEQLKVSGGTEDGGRCLEAALRRTRAYPEPSRQVAVEAVLRWAKQQH